jgi:hypothetical protein
MNNMSPMPNDSCKSQDPGKEPFLRLLCPGTGLPFYVSLLMFFGLLVLAGLIFTPPYLIANDPKSWNNPLSQFFFQLLATIFSVVIGWLLSKYSTKHRDTAKWLPNAGTSISQLLGMLDQVNRLRVSGKTTCDEVKGLFDEPKDKNTQVILSVIENRCNLCKSRLLDLKNQVETTMKTWEGFIDDSCEVNRQCAAMKRKIDLRRDELSRKREQNP